MSSTPARTTWLATIFGGTFAAVAAGIIVFHYQGWISKPQSVEPSKILVPSQKSDGLNQKSDAALTNGRPLKDDGETERSKQAPPCPVTFSKRRDLINNIISTFERDNQY